MNSDVKNFNKYYLKNGLVFSNKKEKLNINTEDETVEIDPTITFPKVNELILSKVEEFKTKKLKKIEVSGKIENFSQIKNKIKKENLIPIKNDDYSFIEFTSQIEIIQGYLKNLENQYFRKLDSSVNSYLRETEEIEKRKIIAVKKNINSNKDKIKKIEIESKNFQNGELKRAEKKIETKKKEIEKLNILKNNFETQIDIKKTDKDTIKIEKIEKKVVSYEHKISDLELQIKIFDSRIKQLKIDFKKGKKKQVGPLIFVATLGLIYWTRFSDTKYKIFKNEQKIYKSEEKILELKRKIKNSKKDISEILSLKKGGEKEKLKKQERLISNFEKNSLEISNANKELKTLEKEFLKKKEKIEQYKDKIKIIKDNSKELEELQEHYNTISSQAIRKIILDLRLMNKENVTLLEKYKKQLESQKIDIQGEWTVEV